MRHPLLASVFFLLLACGKLAPTNQDGGTAGAGGEGGAWTGCARCGQVALTGNATTATCQASAGLIAAVQSCACDPSKCSVECGTSACAGGAADATCKGCLMAKCASTFALCSNDQSTQ